MTFSRMLLVCLAVAMSGACAARQARSVADTFVRQGEPSIDLGGPTPSRDTASYVSQLRKLAAEARPRASKASVDVAEARDPGLKDALRQLATDRSGIAHRRVAIEYRRLGILDVAFRHLTSAVTLDKKDTVAYDLRARIWRAWGLPHLGIPDARKAVRLSPRSPTAWNTLGLLLEESRDRDHAVLAYLRAVVLDDRATYAWHNLCRTWTTRGDATSGVQACRRAIAQDPTHVAAQAHLNEAERMLAGGTGPTPPSSGSVVRAAGATEPPAQH